MDTIARHMEAFDAIALAAGGGAWLGEARRDSFERFRQTGLPTRRLEEWKFTRLDGLARAGFGPVPGAAMPDVPSELLDALTPDGAAAWLVFVGGAYRAELSSPPGSIEGLSVHDLATALAEAPGSLQRRISTAAGPAEALVDLNLAFMSAGAVIELDDGVEIDGPIAIVVVGGGADAPAQHLRHLITLGADARATVTESHATMGGGPAFTNAVTDIRLARGATLGHGRLQVEGREAVHTSRVRVGIDAGASYASFAYAEGAALSRQETDVTFTGEGARAQLLGAYLGRRHQHLDHFTRVDHATPGCVTDELFKGVLDDKAHGVFQGLIRVAPHAVKTDARQKNQALLLSDGAVADAKPELEILADDVKCAHGATVGDLDRDQLFYLAARGIEPETARRLLIAGFIGELVEACDNDHLAAFMAGRIQRWQDRV